MIGNCEVRVGPQGVIQMDSAVRLYWQVPFNRRLKRQERAWHRWRKVIQTNRMQMLPMEMSSAFKEQKESKGQSLAGRMKSAGEQIPI